ncbi:putative clathrin assembly protein [Hibiscus syriacus]|uniref:Clathrin assembly protein n=1 Tax=Hibiscus syriacus TaxID=106335 RepID=A0A6A3C6V8_HIBSY|nr:putative clathrin assembly protein [Hibiscus syriacus]
MSSTIRKAIGTVKDQTSIGIAKTRNTTGDLELTSYSRGYVNACVSAVSKRLGKTRDWIVALKALVLVHRLMNDGDPVFQEEILYATRKGTRLLNMSDFRDEAHSSSWDHSAFVRTYSMYLDQRLELILFDRKSGSGGSGAGGSRYGNGDDRYSGRDNFLLPPLPRQHEYDYGDFRGDNNEYGNYGMTRRTRSYGDTSEAVKRDGREEKQTVTPLREMKPERIFGKMGHLQRLLDRFLSCQPTGLAKNSRMILIALFFDMEYPDCVKAFDAYASAAKQIDELVAFYNFCKDMGVARSSEYPEVQRIREEPEPDMNEIKALPPPENYTPSPPPEPEPVKPPEPQKDLVDLRDDGVTADDQGNKLALALFNGPAANNGSWEAFPSNGQPEVTSAWQTPAAEPGKADWELALVESASNLSRQKAALGGGLDPLLLNGMYDQGMVRQQVSTAHLSGGSASSVALPMPGKTQVLALPAPDGTVQNFNQDPFAASLTIPPPSYVQMADMEKKQHLLVQEQQVWQQYAKNGMQGQASLAKINPNPGYYGPGQMPVMPYGMPPVNGTVPPPGYYYTPY